MKKKKLIGFVVVTIFAMILFGCDVSADDSEGGGNNDNIQSKEGWWKHTTSTDGAEQNTYINYNANGDALRAGADNQEYKGNDFDSRAPGFKFDTLKNSASGAASFTKITDVAELPSWYSGQDNADVWENAPDDVAIITKNALCNGNGGPLTGHGTKWGNFTNNTYYDIIFNGDGYYGPNTELINDLEFRIFVGNLRYDKDDWTITNNRLIVQTSSGELSSKIKIGTDSSGEEVLTLKNASVFFNSFV